MKASGEKINMSGMVPVPQPARVLTEPRGLYPANWDRRETMVCCHSSQLAKLVPMRPFAIGRQAAFTKQPLKMY